MLVGFADKTDERAGIQKNFSRGHSRSKAAWTNPSSRAHCRKGLWRVHRAKAVFWGRDARQSNPARLPLANDQASSRVPPLVLCTSAAFSNRPFACIKIIPFITTSHYL